MTEKKKRPSKIKVKPSHPKTVKRVAVPVSKASVKLVDRGTSPANTTIPGAPYARTIEYGMSLVFYGFLSYLYYKVWK